jgi:hypothetical protein
MAIIGFIVLILLGLFFLFAAITVFIVGSAFGSGGEAIVPAILVGIVLWAAVHWAPFTIAFTSPPTHNVEVVR